jgi:ParB/RepB/Spo0J family partition protein
MSGSSNRRAPIKVSGLVASGRVQIRDVKSEAGAATDGDSPPGQRHGADEHIAATPQVAAQPVASDSEDTTPSSDAGVGFTPLAPANDTSAVDALSASELSESADHDDASATPAVTLNKDSAAVMIPLSLVVDSPYQPRLQYDPEEIDNLAETMREASQGEPVRVRLKNGKYELISGHRRTRAARILGWTEIAAYIEDLTDVQAQAKTMVLAVGNVKLCDYELAKMFNAAITDKVVKNQRAASSYFGIGTTKVNGCLDMLKLPRGIVRFLDQKPNLFGYETAIVIKKLYAEYPNHLADIERGVQRLIEGATQNSLKAWVLQAIKGQSTTSGGTEPNLITSGRRLAFTTKVNADKRAIQVNCKLPDVDLTVLEKDLQAWLEERAKALSPETGDESPASTAEKAS